MFSLPHSWPTTWALKLEVSVPQTTQSNDNVKENFRQFVTTLRGYNVYNHLDNFTKMETAYARTIVMAEQWIWRCLISKQERSEFQRSYKFAIVGTRELSVGRERSWGRPRVVWLGCSAPARRAGARNCVSRRGAQSTPAPRPFMNTPLSMFDASIHSLPSAWETIIAASMWISLR